MLIYINEIALFNELSLFFQYIFFKNGYVYTMDRPPSIIINKKKRQVNHYYRVYAKRT